MQNIQVDHDNIDLDPKYHEKISDVVLNVLGRDNDLWNMLGTDPNRHNRQMYKSLKNKMKTLLDEMTFSKDQI